MIDKSFFQGSEYQKPLTEDGQKRWDDIFGVNCPNCDNTGSYTMSDGGEGLIEYQCQWCHDTPNSKYNKAKANKKRMTEHFDET